MVKFLENEMLINLFYFYKNPKLNRPKPVLTVISKNKDGEVHKTDYEDPDFEYFITKKKYNDGEVRNYIPLDHVDRIVCKYDNLYKSMVSTAKDKYLTEIYNNAIRSSNSREQLRNLHLDYRFHSTDINIEDYYVGKFLDQNPKEENSFGVTWATFDIEVDSSEIVGFPDPTKAECPVNIISLYNDENSTCYVFALNYDNDEYKNYMSNAEAIKASFNRIRDKYKKFRRKIKFVVRKFDYEIDVIAALFQTINELKPNYAMAWNAGFDLLTMYNRIKKLHYSPEEIMCPPEFDNKKVVIDPDLESTDPAERSDTFIVSCYTNYIDELQLYAVVTKPFGKKDSYNLDAIGEEETEMHKEELDSDIKDVHLVNYKNFFEYNIQDSLLAGYIEDKMSNITLNHLLCLMTRTRPRKVWTKTICLRNLADKFYRDFGNAVISNNHSALLPHSNTKIKGAFVGDTNLIDKVSRINGILQNMIFDLVIDFDLKALYPNLIRAYNISPDTAYGKITILDDEAENITPEFMNAYISREAIPFCREFYGLPDLEEMIDIVSSKLQSI